jgi:DNA uptake protein ComE-like DNA-binding protein
MTMLYGEDANLNGILDPNENDGDVLPPSDNMNGQLEPGLLEFVTVYSHEPNTFTNIGSTGTVTNTARFNLTTYTAANEQQLVNIFVTNGISSDRARQIVQGAGGGPFGSPMAFYYAASQGSGNMTTTEFMQVENSVRGSNIVGLININTASVTVLNAIPAWQNGQAQQVVAYRPSITNQVGLNTSMIWLTQVLSQQDVLNAAPYLTGKSFQFSADIAAVGHNGRGYRRTRFVFDTSTGSPVIAYRQDLSNLGWALGKEVRDKYLLGKNTL